MPETTPLSVISTGPPPACPEAFNLTEHTLAAGLANPDKTAIEVIIAPGTIAESHTYGALRAAIHGTMRGLREAGVTPGDRVLLRLGHTLDFPIVHFAAIGIGALPVPTSMQLTRPELGHVIDTVAPAFVAGDATHGLPCFSVTQLAEWRDLPAAPYVQTRANDPAYIVFTSGTGGQPRGVVHAHRAGHARRMMWRDWYDLRPNDRLLHAGAFNWTYTLGTGLTDPWAAGASALIYAGPPDKGIWSALAAAHAPTLFAAAPGVYRQLLASGTVTRDAFAALRHALSASEALPERLREDWRTASGCDVYEALGMSEVSTYVSQSPGRAGMRVQRGRKVAILGPTGHCPVGSAGELAVSTQDPGLMLGYWRGTDQPPDLPQKDGWFRTGDRAVMDGTGHIQHLGRADDLMNAQGYRVAPQEVEAVLSAHTGVEEAAVLALEVRPGVEVIAAFVTPRPHAELSEGALSTYCVENLARYKCPRQIHILNALPRTATGKVLKRKLRAAYSPEGDA